MKEKRKRAYFLLILSTQVILASTKFSLRIRIRRLKEWKMKKIECFDECVMALNALFASLFIVKFAPLSSPLFMQISSLTPQIAAKYHLPHLILSTH